MTGFRLRDHPMGLTRRVSVADVEYAEYKATRDRFKDAVLRQLDPAIEASGFPALENTPYPIKFRNQGALDHWRRLFHSYDWGQTIWNNWTKAHATCLDCVNELRWQVEEHLDPTSRRRQMPGWSDTVVANVVKWAANIHFDRKSGALIETTPVLDTLLMHSDLDATLPMQLFSPPFPAQYVRVDRATAEQLASPEDRVNRRWIDGVFCFASRPESSGSPNDFVTVIELVIVYKKNDKGISARMLRGPLILPDETVTDWVDSILVPHTGKRTAGDESLLKLINYMVKVFLYLGLKDARKVVGTEYSAALGRLAALGPKKQAKMQRRLESLYDRITVGPATIPAVGATHADHASRAPHWRRGHFRSQPCGPARSARKLIFVAPILIRADRLGNEAPRPKSYELTLGRASSCA